MHKPESKCILLHSLWLMTNTSVVFTEVSTRVYWCVSEIYPECVARLLPEAAEREGPPCRVGAETIGKVKTQLFGLSGKQNLHKRGNKNPTSAPAAAAVSEQLQTGLWIRGKQRGHDVKPWRTEKTTTTVCSYCYAYGGFSFVALLRRHNRMERTAHGGPRQVLTGRTGGRKNTPVRTQWSEENVSRSSRAPWHQSRSPVSSEFKWVFQLKTHKIYFHLFKRFFFCGVAQSSTVYFCHRFNSL